MRINSGTMHLLIGVLLFVANAFAYAGTVVIVTSRLGAGYDDLIDTLRDEVLRATNLKLKPVVIVADGTRDDMRMPPDSQLIVTVGLQAAHQILNMSDSILPVLSVLVPRVSYDNLDKRVERNSPKHSAIFIDQPPSRQIELLRQVLPATRRIGVILGPSTQQDLPTYRALASARGLTLVAEKASRESELYPVLQSVLSSADAFLALPDSTIVNVSTAQNLLLTSFRLRIPVIGYSASYVRAGALAAVYSTPQQIGLEAGQIIRQYVAGGVLPLAKYPRYYSVSVNTQIADSLGLTVPDESVLLRRLQQQEGLE